MNLIVQVERQRDGGRRVTQVTEIAGMEGDTQLLNDIFKFEVTGETSTTGWAACGNQVTRTGVPRRALKTVRRNAIGPDVW